MGRGRSRRRAAAPDPEREGEEALAASEKTNIPTDLLRTFVAIHELGSFTKAAQLLALTQPAVSAQMRRLEGAVGVDLIEKNLTGVRLTECGEDVLRHARRILSINDQIVGTGGQQPSSQLIRLGIPNLFAPSKLARLLSGCRGAAGGSLLQLCCDHSTGLLQSVRSGYLDLACVFGDEEAMQPTLTTWSEQLVWVKVPGLGYEAGSAVPLVSSPNLLFIDRMAMAALDGAGLRYEIVFTAFDGSSRRAAAVAGLGFFPIPRALVVEPLVIEDAGVLPPLPNVTVAIIARDELDTEALAPLIEAFKTIMTTPV